ncbi:MAG: NTP transferase domain-containing protein [Candidatus Heimdallarchaeota archaeon]|nr:NTP transferase domain-containing protein [Candidatus Heimdallarchaeota archaeon]
MISIILAAGKGKRMQPLTDTRLKGSLPIQNQPILFRLIDRIDQAGFMDKLVLVISPWQKKQMKELFSQKSYANKITYAIQDPPKGTADAVAQAEEFMGDEKRCLVFNGDIVAHIEDILPELVSHHEQLKAKCTMAVFPGKNDRYGLLKVSSEGIVEDIKEKVKAEEISEEIGYINAGIYLFEREVFDAIRATPLSQRKEYEITDTISILGENGKIGALVIDSWMSLENPLDLLIAQEFFPPTKEQLNMQFHTGGEIGFKAAEEIFFEKDSVIEISSITITGPVLIGKGTLIEQGSKIGPQVFIGSDCEIGANTTIKNSLIMDNCRIESECILSNIVSAEEVLIGKNSQLQPKKVKELIVIGGETIISNKVIIKKGMKIEAHSAITKDVEI